MVIVSSLLGACLAGIGYIFFRRQKKILGTFLLVVGGLLILLGVIAMLRFHL